MALTKRYELSQFIAPLPKENVAGGGSVRQFSYTTPKLGIRTCINDSCLAFPHIFVFDHSQYPDEWNIKMALGKE
jgi:hypothetical protein